MYADPRYLDFQTWASLLTEQLAAYNVPAPVEEAAWQDWAEVLCSSAGLTGQGMVDPRGFADWREWASHIVQGLHA